MEAWEKVISACAAGFVQQLIPGAMAIVAEVQRPVGEGDWLAVLSITHPDFAGDRVVHASAAISSEKILTCRGEELVRLLLAAFEEAAETLQENLSDKSLVIEG